VSKSPYPPTRHPFLPGPGHWSMTLGADGKPEDIWHFHCERHPHYEVPCTQCVPHDGASDHATD
jgi:hypothetical protein